MNDTLTLQITNYMQTWTDTLTLQITIYMQTCTDTLTLQITIYMQTCTDTLPANDELHFRWMNKNQFFTATRNKLDEKGVENWPELRSTEFIE